MTRPDLRVGLVVPRFWPFPGGVETYTEQAARGLAARGVEVTVITQVPRGLAEPRRCRRDGYAVERYPLPVGSVFNVPAPAAVAAATRARRFDVLWVHSYHTPLAWLVSERAAGPVVLTPHYHGVGHTLLHAAMHRPYRPAGRRLIRRSARIIVDTEAEAALLHGHFPQDAPHDKLDVVPLAVDNPVRGEPFPTTGVTVLTVARQEPYKRTDLLIRAMATLRGQRDDVRLVVVGGGSAERALRSLTADLGLQDRVVLTGRISDEELGRWWATATVYATASEQEAFGVSLAQALTAGLPVVASGIPAHEEVVARSGVRSGVRLVRHDGAGTHTRYAEALRDLLGPGPAARPPAATADRCLLPTPDEVADRLLDVLTRAARRPSDAPAR